MLAVFVTCSALSSMPKKEADWENINTQGPASMNEEKRESEKFVDNHSEE